MQKLGFLSKKSIKTLYTFGNQVLRKLERFFSPIEENNTWKILKNLNYEKRTKIEISLPYQEVEEYVSSEMSFADSAGWTKWTTTSVQ